MRTLILAFVAAITIGNGAARAEGGEIFVWESTRGVSSDRTPSAPTPDKEDVRRGLTYHHTVPNRVDVPTDGNG
jgi:hypothetical protein